jgi:uncharacterized phage protein (TIGR01671 family)
MKDRFRFRAWDNKENKYIYDAEMTYDNLGIGAECFGFMVDGTYKDQYTVEQCTGVKDSKGKLIYEGDIIRCSCGSEYYVGCVVWDSEEIQFSVEIDEELYSFIQHSKNHKIEIIGNIHENPELVK